MEGPAAHDGDVRSRLFPKSGMSVGDPLVCDSFMPIHFTELLEAMRRGNRQLLIAPANHGHDDAGQPVFRVPVGAE